MIPPISSSSPDRWTPESATQLARSVCLTQNLPARDLVLIRFGTNAVFEVAGADLALRLRRPGTPPEEIARQVDLAVWLAEQNFPVNRPAEGFDVLHEGLDGATASFWEWVNEDPRKHASVAELGKLLRDLHVQLDRYLGADDFPLWNPFHEIEHRIRTIERNSDDWPGSSQIKLLRQWTRENSADLGEINWRLTTGLVHGDAHVGNVLTAETGTNLLIDLDAVSRGHREWDLVPTAVSRLRFRADPASIEDFTAAYGFDLLEWSGWPALRQLRELYMTSWLMSVANSRARQEEVEHRMRCLAEGDEQAIWHPV
jgi:Ser/Thr protein kinase RdoA (MazF antagonist)